jgi:hypothetical protein
MYILSGSCTSDTAGHRLRPNNLDVTRLPQQPNNRSQVPSTRDGPTALDQEARRPLIQRRSLGRWATGPEKLLGTKQLTKILCLEEAIPGGAHPEALGFITSGLRDLSPSPARKLYARLGDSNLLHQGKAHRLRNRQVHG